MFQKFLYYLSIIILTLAFSLQPTGYASAAATCQRSACNGVDPNPYYNGAYHPTTCWNDKSIAAISNVYNGNSGKVQNINYYSPGCIANFSYTVNMNSPKVYRYLGAGTEYYYTYYATKLYQWVWNSMIDGTNTVCTNGYQGNSYGVYDTYYGLSTPGTPWICA